MVTIKHQLVGPRLELLFYQIHQVIIKSYTVSLWTCDIQQAAAVHLTNQSSSSHDEVIHFCVAAEDSHVHNMRLKQEWR